MYRYNVNISLARLRGNIILILFFLSFLSRVMGSSATQGSILNSVTLDHEEPIAGDEEDNDLEPNVQHQQADQKGASPTMVIGLTDGTKVNYLVKNVNLLNKKLFSFKIPERYSAKAESFTYSGSSILQVFSLKGCLTNVAISLPEVERINMLILRNTKLQDIKGYPILRKIGTLYVQNSPLTNISGLNKVTQIHALFLGNNPKLTDITGLQALKSIKYIGIKNRAHLDKITIIRRCTPELHILVQGYTREIMPYFVEAIYKVIVAYTRKVTPLASLANNIGHVMQEYCVQGNDIFVLNDYGVFGKKVTDNISHD